MNHTKQICIILASLSAAFNSGGVVYVDHQADPAQADGTSWASALPSIQEAINTAATHENPEIWIKKGSYKPHTDNREVAFQLKPGVKIYGGFKGSETDRGQRKPKTNRTILSGDIGRIGTRTDNSRHVIIGASDTLLDGITIQFGHSDRQSGAALHLTNIKGMLLTHCILEKNHALHGGAIYAASSSLSLSNCTFYSNSAQSGGAIYATSNSTIRSTGTIFSANYSKNSGGAIQLNGSNNAGFIDTSFLANTTDTHGGALAIEAQNNPNHTGLFRCLFSGNTAKQSGGALHTAGSATPILANSSFNQNRAGDQKGSLHASDGSKWHLASVTFAKGVGQEFDGATPKNSISANPTAETLAYFSTQPSANSAPLNGTPKQATPSVADTKNHTQHRLQAAEILTPNGTPQKLKAFTSNSDFTLFTLGDLTDPEFSRSYRIAEAAAMDYANQTSLRFFHLYRALVHPENHGHLPPFNPKERLQQIQIIKKRLTTRIPWIADSMNNSTLKELQDKDQNTVFIYNQKGFEVYRGHLSNETGLRNKLTELLGPAPKKTHPNTLPAPKTSPHSTPEHRSTLPPKQPLRHPLIITPDEPNQPHYVKPRIEADQALLTHGNGTLYLGLRIDPLYQLEWNPISEHPIKYTISVPNGSAVAPSIGKGKKSRSTAQARTAPYEFILEVGNMDESRELHLQISYAVQSTSRKRASTITRHYTVRLIQDPFGGHALSRTSKNARHAAKKIIKHATTEGFDALLRKYDLDRDQKLSLDEAPSSLFSIFNEIDTTQDGQITKPEFEAYQP